MADDDFQARFRKQTATVWKQNGVDSGGDPEFTAASPFTITVRWEERNDNLIGTDGESFMSQAVVYPGIDLVPGDYLYLGTNTTADPTTVTGAFEVKKFEKIPSPSAKKFIRKATL